MPTVFLADLEANADSPSGRDVDALLRSLRSHGIPTRAISVVGHEQPLHEALKQMASEDMLLGTVGLLHNCPAFAVNASTPWLREPFAAGRRLGLSRGIRHQAPVRPFSPYFIKASVEKELPGATCVRTSAQNDRIRRVLSNRPEAAVVIGPIHSIASEERFFVVNGALAAHASYRGPRSETSLTLAKQFIAQSGTTNAAVDVATSATGEAFVVETNPLFVAGLYGVDPLLILPGCTKTKILHENKLA